MICVQKNSLYACVLAHTKKCHPTTPLLHGQSKKKKIKKSASTKKSQPTFPYMATVFNFLPKLSDVNLNNIPKQRIPCPLVSLNEQLFMSQSESHDPLKLSIPLQLILQYYQLPNVR